MLSEQPVLGTRGMVACAHYLATQAGLSILTQGGNAVDAAIAANMATTVVYPSTCSAGGDIFMLICSRPGRVRHRSSSKAGDCSSLVPFYGSLTWPAPIAR